MTAGVYNCPWYAVVGIVAFGALCGWVAWRITTPATPPQVDPTDARQRFTHVRSHHADR